MHVHETAELHPSYCSSISSELLFFCVAALRQI